jgi:hypothetical protein
MQKNILTQHESASLHDILDSETKKVCYLETMNYISGVAFHSEKIFEFKFETSSCNLGVCVFSRVIYHIYL